MKRNSVLSSIALSVALSAFLTGCGSSGTTTDNTENPQQPQLSTTTIDGKAVDGYLQYATVCLDMNNDGYCQADEPSTQTDENGTFRLTLSSQIQEDPNFNTAMLLVYGGKDIDTNMDFTGKLLAPQDGTTVILSPVTTLVAKELQKTLQTEQNLSKEQIQTQIQAARQKVAQALDIPEEDIDKDPVEELAKGNDNLIKKSLQLQKSVEALLAATPADTDKNDRAEQIYEALAEALDNLDSQLSGVDALIDATLAQAQQDQEVKELIGGDESLKVADAAKKISETIKARFENSDEEVKNDQDFLKKIAIITEEDLKKIEIAVEEGTEDEIAGQITIKDEFFQPDFDWSSKFLEYDLATIGIDATPELIEKLKLLFKDKEIEPNSLFDEKELLKESTDAEIQTIYQNIERYLGEEEANRLEYEAEISDKVIPIQAPVSVYTRDDDSSYSKITFNTDNTLSFQKYTLQDDGTFALQSPDTENIEYILIDGQWQQHADNATEPYTLNADGSISLPTWNEKAYLLEGQNIAGTSVPVSQYQLDVLMPQDAKMYLIKIEKTDDTYRLDNIVEDYSTQPPVAITSFSRLIQTHCGYNWFEGDAKGGLSFAGTLSETGEYICDTSATEGKLTSVYIDENGNTQTGHISGEWEIKTVEGQDIMIIKPYNFDDIQDDEGDISYPIFSVIDGQLFRGQMEPKETTHVIPAYNQAALEAITTTLAHQFKDLQESVPFDFGQITQ